MQRLFAATSIVFVLLLSACGGSTAVTGSTASAVQPTTTTAGGDVSKSTASTAQEATATTAPAADTATSAPAADTATTAPAADTATSAPAPTETSPAPTDTAAPPTDTAVPPTATAAAGKIEVLQFTNYPDSLGDIYVVGTVQNSGQSALQSIQIVASAIDKDGNIIDTGSDLLLSGWDKMEAGQILPFKVLFDKPSAEIAKIDIQAQAEAYDPNGFHFTGTAQGLTIEGTKLNPSTNKYSGPKFTGRVKNGGTANASLVEVIATGYGDDGKILDVNNSYAKIDPLTPGGTSPFEVTFSRTDVQISKVDAVVTGYEKK